MKRTKQEIIRTASTLKDQAENCPEISPFDGTDNSEDIEWLHETARQLYAAAGDHLDEVTSDDVKSWLNGEPSEIDDCF